VQCSGRTEGAQVVQHHLSGGSKEPGMATNPISFRDFLPTKMYLLLSPKRSCRHLLRMLIAQKLVLREPKRSV